MKIGVISLGCSKNRVDTEVMLGSLKKMGHVWTVRPEEADTIIINTCGFIQSAKEEAIDTILQMAQYKERGVRYLIAAGCLTERYSQEIFEGIPELDAVLGIGQFLHLDEVFRRLETGERVLWTGDKAVLYGCEPRVLTTQPWSAYIKIAEGCNNRCTYCAIPDIRGSFRSRSVEDVIAEIETLAAQGVREVVLVSQDTTRFGRDRGRGELPELIRQACGVEGIEWVRPLYLYPDEVDDALLDAMEDEKVCAYLDIPIQHADNGMLRAMNRRSTRHGLVEMMTRIRQRSKKFALRTSIIVGFPGEDEAAFNSLLDFLQAHPFDRLGAFAYSPEEGTRAETFAGQVPEAVKQQRLSQVMGLQKTISRRMLHNRIGSTEWVLVEENGPEGCYGRTQREAPEVDGLVWFMGEGLLPGTFARVRITSANEHDLQGELI